MNQIKKFKFRKVRGFSDCISTTFDFTRMNYKMLFKIFVRIPGPLILIASAIIAYSVTDMIGQIGTRSYQQTNELTDLFPFSGYLILGWIVFMIASLLLSASVNEYIVMYEKSEDPSVITISDIFQRAKNRFWTYLGGGIVAILMVSAAFVLLIIPGIYVGISIVFLYIIISAENLPVGKAISRSFKVISGNWWAIFGFLIVMGIILLFISYLIQIPLVILNTFLLIKQSGSMLYKSMYIMSTTISYIVYSATSAITSIAVAIYYYSIVEKKEQVGLQQEINKMDEKPEEPVES